MQVSAFHRLPGAEVPRRADAFFRERRGSRQRGFTLLELATVVLIISILVVLAMPLAGEVRKRLDRARCTANLRNLHVAANLYVQEHRSWPQIPSIRSSSPETAAARWISALKPYGPEQGAWICPTIQRLLGGPDMSKPENVRVDYAGTPFDTNPQTPFKWSTMPWFIESANAHGNGNLLIFSDGHIQDLYELREKTPQKPLPGS